jgi:hypothetical protein
MGVGSGAPSEVKRMKSIRLKKKRAKSTFSVTKDSSSELGE